MSRKKSSDQARLYSKNVSTRVSTQVYDRLKSLIGRSDCHSIGEIARRILSEEKIKCFTVDRTMDGPMEELCRIRKEINAIGTNINQITHAFHTAETASQKVLHAVKVAEQYRKVGDKVNELLPIISQFSKKWLQK